MDERENAAGQANVGSEQGPPTYNDGGEEDGGVVAAVIPYKNSAALIGYYLGIFGLIPCIGLPLALAAVPFGVAGIRRYRQEPRVRGIVHAWVAVVLGALSSIVWLAFLGLVVFGALSGK